MQKRYKDEYGKIWKLDGKFWKVFRDGAWHVTSGKPSLELKEIVK